MAGLNEVAVANPYSWFPERREAADLVTVTADNRMIATPYPKYLNAVMDVDMSAAVIVTDAETARERRPCAGRASPTCGDGPTPARSGTCRRGRRSTDPPPSRGASDRRSATAGISADEIGAFDLYACFPSSVEVSRDALGVRARGPASVSP